MEYRKILRPTSLSFIFIFFGWIFLFGQSIQTRYINFTFLGLVLFLIISSLYKKPQRFSNIDLFLFIYLFFVTLTLPFSENKTIALEWYKMYILPIPFIYLIFRNIDKKYIFPIAFSIFIFSSLIVIIGLLEAIFRKNILYELWVENPFYYRFIYERPRIMSTLIHPTVFGSFLLGCLPFSFFLTLHIKRPYKILVKIVILFLILGVIFSFSRGNISGLLGLSLIYLILSKKVRYIKFIFIGIFILIIFSSTLLKHRFSFERFSIHALTGKWWLSEKEKSAITSKILKEYPLLGIGLNHYRLKFDLYSSDKYKQEEKGLKKKGIDPYEWKIPDNMYLSILAETGILGFFSFILFLSLLFKNTLGQFKIIKYSIEKEFLIACLCGIIGLLISMNTYDLLYWVNPLLLFWSLIGILSNSILYS